MADEPDHPCRVPVVVKELDRQLWTRSSLSIVAGEKSGFGKIWPQTDD